jgi:hypothetical protein
MPCVLATNFFSFYVGAALLAVLFPLFILVAMDSEPGDIMSSGLPAAAGAAGRAVSQHATVYFPSSGAVHLLATCGWCTPSAQLLPRQGTASTAEHGSC